MNAYSKKKQTLRQKKEAVRKVLVSTTFRSALCVLTIMFGFMYVWQTNTVSTKGYQITYNYRNGYGKPWKPYFAENSCITNKSVRCFCQTVGKISPYHNPRHVKNHRWHSISRQLSYFTKDYGKYESSEERLNHIPERSENGLFVYGHKVTSNKEEHQIPIAPQSRKMQVKPTGNRFDYVCPFLCILCVIHAFRYLTVIT